MYTYPLLGSIARIEITSNNTIRKPIPRSSYQMMMFTVIGIEKMVALSVFTLCCPPYFHISTFESKKNGPFI